jgi:DNA-binding NarL/FixJ family response regulator
VVGIVSDGRATLRAPEELKPDVIVLDIAMPVLSGLDAGQKVKEMLPMVKLAYLTMNTDAGVAAEAFERGASGYAKDMCLIGDGDCGAGGFRRQIAYVTEPVERRGGLFAVATQELVTEEERLTARQREVLQLLAEGRVTKELAYILNMKMRTVAHHKYRMMEVLGARSNADLVKYAVRNHVIAA